jgi:hypothetical protein
MVASTGFRQSLQRDACGMTERLTGLGMAYIGLRLLRPGATLGEESDNLANVRGSVATFGVQANPSLCSREENK